MLEETLLRWFIVARTLECYDFERNTYKKGKLSAIALEFGKSEKTIRRIKEQYFQQRNENGRVPDMALKHSEKSGRPSALTAPMMDLIKHVDDKENGFKTQGMLAEVLDVSKSTMTKWLKKMETNITHSYLKPKSTAEHKHNRLEFVMSRILPNCMECRSFFDQVHLDESWFYLRNETELVRLYPGDE